MRLLLPIAPPKLVRKQTNRAKLNKLVRSSVWINVQRKKAFDSKSLVLAVGFFTQRVLDRYKDPQEGKAEAEKMQLEIGMGSVYVICYTKIFWRDGKVQEQVLKDYLTRIKLVPQATEDEWSEALIKVNGGNMETPLLGKPLKMPTILGAIIAQDRLFDANIFKQQESKKLLARMKAIPQDAIDKSATARQLVTYYAAISLINTESLFINETFQQELFAKRLQAITKK